MCIVESQAEDKGTRRQGDKGKPHTAHIGACDLLDKGNVLQSFPLSSSGQTTDSPSPTHSLNKVKLTQSLNVTLNLKSQMVQRLIVGKRLKSTRSYSVNALPGHCIFRQKKALYG